MSPSPFIRWLRDIRLADIALVGGKTASLGELYGELRAAGVRVPDGFAITATAYRALLDHDGLRDRLAVILKGVTGEDVAALAVAGAELRRLVESAPLPAGLEDEIASAYRALGREYGPGEPTVAVRSSATAEDLPQASFAGQHESFLGIQGEAPLLSACRRCFASIFTDRAIVYRIQNGFDHLGVFLSVVVQKMVASDRASSGVVFTLDPDSGFREVILVNGAFGLGEAVVQGQLDPDEFWIFKPTLRTGHRALLKRKIALKTWKLALGADGKPERVAVPREAQAAASLTEGEALELGRFAVAIEEHYSRRAGSPVPMDIEWAKDSADGRLYILQARPETVHRAEHRSRLEVFSLPADAPRQRLVSGAAIGQRIGVGPTRRLRDVQDLATFQPGDVLVAAMTDPDWEPIMKRAAAIVTDRGGRTCHAAIVSRELGVPCVVGTGNATEILADEQVVTVSCAEGETGSVYRGALAFERRQVELGALPKTTTKVQLNVGNPGEAFRLAALPNDGVGLARIEFIIASFVRVHPLALLHPERIADQATRAEIHALTQGYPDPGDYFVGRLAEGVGTIAAAFYPKDVIVRLSDFKSSEYAGLVGGRDFEPEEGNPMLGFRGAFRYAHPRYREAFALECRALRRVREEMGLTNVKLMIPFCRTPAEGRRVLDLLTANGLARGVNGLEVYVMAEIPSNAILADEFAAIFDGFSIGSNDLTQLTLGVDRDSALVAFDYDERDPGVKEMIRLAVEGCRRNGVHSGLCGQAPSDYPDMAEFLVEIGIDSISLNPDSVVRTTQVVLDLEKRLATPDGAAH
ncbi:MAG TPA: phosphoenolpyruvate synthase, partial [Methylomirabilota bacterium]|nr:phosphoenolpyruvate synthase [Methylomirabilota bacterium]